uniref:Uncharacterized protein n=1 Tax=Romanomermis culicivorax TaxID=13658 RepID=A0A915HGE1_ROMCU
MPTFLTELLCWHYDFAYNNKILKVFEIWYYNNVEQYHPTKNPDSGLFTQYFNTFMKMKLLLKGQPSREAASTAIRLRAGCSNEPFTVLPEEYALVAIMGLEAVTSSILQCMGITCPQTYLDFLHCEARLKMSEI